ncbi:hypothetical protein M2371_000182 [Buttiauxella sp. BIGb0471]|uniref:hypothetical protein n=1 Tax=Buttiauxella sp. BIGb0471 TaxID=2940597 RepID=UPI00216806BA|nr:hypothetical protein [Buttiauxella sp. BIGb0471]MCS3600996.1 hypothetical protein [Buttiauxella sp. BIGb0471]
MFINRQIIKIDIYKDRKVIELHGVLIDDALKIIKLIEGVETSKFFASPVSENNKCNL